MAAQNLLVVLLAGASHAQLRRAVEQYGEGWPTVHVVSPARVGKLEWLATDEDEARAEAAARALEAEWILADEAGVEGEAGDVDPVQAVEDALRTFPAEEIVLIGGAGENGALEASLRDFGVPVRRIGASWPGARDQFRQGVRQIVAGRSKATPFVFFVAVNLFLLISAALISLLVLLVLWLR